VLVDSLEYNSEALTLISELIVPQQKLTEDFQRQKGYEKLIDFLHNKNKNVEAKLLEPEVVHKIMSIIEEATMN